METLALIRGILTSPDDLGDRKLILPRVQYADRNGEFNISPGSLGQGISWRWPWDS